MKRIPTFPLLLFTALVLTFAQIASAQTLQGFLGQFFGVNNQGSQEQLRSFAAFLQHHPELARELRERPERVNEPSFLDRRQDLRQWLNDHPEAARAFRENPQVFMDRERHFEYYNGDLSGGDEHRRALAHFDWFLDSHPDIRRELMHRPELAGDHFYLDHHPDLRAYLDQHPAVREELRDHPREFMDREARFENGA